MCAFRILLISTLLWVSGCKTGEVVQQPTTQVQEKIYFNSTEDYDPFPSVGSIMDERGRLIGSGVLIRPDVVLTAGHVVDDRAYSFFIGEEEILIDAIKLHPDYNHNNNIETDIALVFLACDSIYTPAELQGKEETLTRGNVLTTVGYSGGVKRYSTYGTFWYYGTLITQPSQIKWLPLEATIWFCYFDAKLKLVGVMSHLSSFKDRAYENSATSVPYFYDWIMEELNEQLVTYKTNDVVNNLRCNHLWWCFYCWFVVR